MRDVERYAALGGKRLEEHPQYSMGVMELRQLTDGVKDKDAFYDSIIMAYNAGIEAGYRMAKKNGKE